MKRVKEKGNLLAMSSSGQTKQESGVRIFGIALQPTIELAASVYFFK